MAMLRVMLVVLAAQVMASAQTGAASVEGVVVNAQSSEPLARAQLELRSVDSGPARVYSQTTGATGRFTFGSVMPGRYQLTAMRQGYVRGDYGVRGPGASGIALTLSDAQHVADVRLAMVPTGTISGRITNHMGEAVGNVHVRALRYGYLDGRRTLINVKSVFTNDLGEYRLGWLPPGRYNVSALHPDSAAGSVNSPEVTNSSTTWANTAVTNAGGFNGGSFEFTENPDPAVRSRIGLSPGDEYLPVFYPGTFDLRSATVIDLRAGAETAGIDMAVFPTRTGTISGTVSLPAAIPIPSLPIQVFRNPSYNLQPLTVRVDSRTGTFTVSGLAPGSYILSSSIRSGEERLAAHTGVDVTEGGHSSAQLMLETGIRIPARVVLDASAAKLNPRNIRVSLRTDPLIPGVGETPTAIPGDDGTLQLSGVLPGEYIVNVSPLMNLARITQTSAPPAVPGPATIVEALNLREELCRGSASFNACMTDGRPLVDQVRAAQPATPSLYVKSIRLGDEDLLNNKLRVDRRAFDSPIEIVLAANGGELNGAVVDSRGRAVRATVVLVPDVGKRHRLDLYKTIVTDNAGRFRLSGVPPDDYQLFAWEDIETGAWLEPEFIAAIERQGTFVKMTEGGRVATQLTAIRQR
jgi:hypothetical protein